MSIASSWIYCRSISSVGMVRQHGVAMTHKVACKPAAQAKANVHSRSGLMFLIPQVQLTARPCHGSRSPREMQALVSVGQSRVSTIVSQLSTSNFQSESWRSFQRNWWRTSGEVLEGDLRASFAGEKRQKHFPPKLHRKFHHQTSLRGSGLWRALVNRAFTGLPRRSGPEVLQRALQGVPSWHSESLKTSPQSNLRALFFLGHSALRARWPNALLGMEHFVRENQTSTELRSTISRHLLQPISRWGKTVDSYRRSCRNNLTSHRNRAFSRVPENGKIPLGKKGAKATQNGNHNLVHV